ncbi:MAG: ABC transporter permease subunit [Clostridiaceae bacterium]
MKTVNGNVKTGYLQVFTQKPLLKKIKNSRILLLMLLPAVIYYILFQYKPMWGVLIAFKQYSIYKGFEASPWVGLRYFISFFSSPDSFVVIKNTLLLSFYMLVWEFPIPIMFALMLNEVGNLKAKKFVQTVSYMPHFISTVVVCSMLTMFLNPSTGVINNLLDSLGYERIYFLSKDYYFRTIYIASGIWKETGFNSIIYLAAIAGIDLQLYESAKIDGANKWRQIIHITIPCIAPTIVILFILNMGQLMNVGFDKAFLLQMPATYSTSDVISTYVYRSGIKQGNFSYGTAIGLFNSIINIVFLLVSNTLAKHAGETSLW